MKKTMIGLLLCGAMMAAGISVFAQSDSKNDANQVEDSIWGEEENYRHNH